MGAKPVDIRRAAMDLLARREHSRLELRQKLQRRFGDVGEIIAEEISRLADEGLQSDRRMAEAFVRARTARGQGPMRIRMELTQRGVGDTDVAEALRHADPDIDWFTLAREVCRKRFGDVPPIDAKERGKRSRFLQQRGFSFDHISAALSDH